MISRMLITLFRYNNRSRSALITTMNKGSVIDEEDPCKVNPDGRQSIATAYPEKSISIPEADGPRQPLLHLLIAALGTELESPTRTGALEITASSGTLPTGTASSAGSRSDLNSGDHDCEYEEDGNDDDDQDAGDHTGDRYVVDGDKAIDFVRGKVDPSSSSVPRRTRKRFDQGMSQVSQCDRNKRNHDIICRFLSPSHLPLRANRLRQVVRYAQPPEPPYSTAATWAPARSFRVQRDAPHVEATGKDAR